MEISVHCTLYLKYISFTGDMKAKREEKGHLFSDPLTVPRDHFTHDPPYKRH